MGVKLINMNLLQKPCQRTRKTILKNLSKKTEKFQETNKQQNSEPAVSKITYPKKVVGKIEAACCTLFNLPDDVNEEFIWNLFGTKRMPGLKRLKIKGRVAYMDFYHEASQQDQMQQLSDKVKIENHKLIFLSEHGNIENEQETKNENKIREVTLPYRPEPESKASQEKSSDLNKEQMQIETTQKTEQAPKIEEKTGPKKSNKDFRSLFLK